MSLSADFLSPSDSDNETDMKYLKPILVRKRSKQSLSCRMMRSNGRRPVLRSRKLPEASAGSRSDTELSISTSWPHADSLLTSEPEFVKANTEPCPKRTHIMTETLLESSLCNDNSSITYSPSHSQSSSPKPVKVKVRDPDSISEMTYEYGAPIKGYRFVGNERDLKNYLEAKKLKLPSVEAENTELKIDPLIFDKYERKSHTKAFDDVSLYLKREPGTTRVPIPNAPLIGEVTVEAIKSVDIRSFLEKCASHLNTSVRELLKQERVAWHPDKALRGSTRVATEDLSIVTKVFQTVNSLWEETRKA
ncbi:LANO_0G05886g1_1 [Lachancea nothofagi CBS 11611]|uniref:LANO_0G05886g1_1 n=1 Tax=Lachancea nothofagi CBS 11611 TaxID=1266666 RepID=A0A1G4KGS8_9SACH|nr:LANO_0G05886g1_1 [Lachancea nothofagi CBS 11611]